MDAAYSLTLLASLVAAGVALGAVALAWAGPARAPSLRRLGRLGSAVALGTMLLSAGIHLAFGHRPGTPKAVAPAAFLAEHPAFSVVALLSLAAFLGSRWGGRRA